MKNGVNWGNGFAIDIGDTDTKNFFQVNKENFTFVTFKIDYPIKWKLMYLIISF